MKANEIMHRGIKAVEESETLESAAQSMRDSDVGVLPVVSGGRVVGVLTDRDIVTRCLAEDKDYHTEKISNCMTQNVVCLSENSDLEDISSKMIEHKISRVFLEDSQHKPVGVISVEDLARNSDPKLFKDTMAAIKS